MKRGHVPFRTCRGCGRKAPQHELDRFVLEAGRLVEDDRGQGRGFYCCSNVHCLAKIEKKLRKQMRVRADKVPGRE